MLEVVDLPQRGQCCVAFREWTATGKTDLRLGRVPSRKVYQVLFPGGRYALGSCEYSRVTYQNNRSRNIPCGVSNILSLFAAAEQQ